MFKWIAIFGTSVLCAPILLGAIQTQSSTRPLAFEVASIKRNLDPPPGVQVVSLKAGLNHGRLTFQQVTFRNLIQQAFNVQRDRIEGCPRWCDEDRFDLVAQADDRNASQDQVTEMLRTILAERFKMEYHREKKDVAGYVLTVSRSGPKLQAAEDDETLALTTKGFVRTFRKFPMAGVANFLANAARQPVLDMTDLKGVYDFTIDLTPTEVKQPVPDGIPRAADPGEAFAALSAAVEAQLGLKLESRKVAIENFVIDKIDHPSEN